MPAPLNPNLWPSVLHDEDGIPIGPLNPLPVTGGGGGGGAAPNQPTFAQGQKRPAASGTAEKISPGQAVPNGFTIFVRAFIDNQDVVYIGKTQANAQNPAVGSPLEPGAFATLALTDVSAIWVNSLTTGDGVFWYVEAAA